MKGALLLGAVFAFTIFVVPMSMSAWGSRCYLRSSVLGLLQQIVGAYQDNSGDYTVTHYYTDGYSYPVEHPLLD